MDIKELARIDFNLLLALQVLLEERSAAGFKVVELERCPQVETADFNHDATTRMTAALNILDDRTRHIIEARWLTEDKKTLHELADVYGVSAERIRQLEANAIKKLRNAMAV